MTRALAILLALSVTTADAQLSHELPPPVNLVGAGFNLEHANHSKQVALWTAIIGGTMTAVLARENKGAAWTVGGLTLGMSVGFNLHGLRWENRAADLLQCGYSPTELYEQIPDSLGDDPPVRYRIPAMINGTRIHLPARFK